MAIAFQPNAFQTTYPGSLYAFQGAEREVFIVSIEVREKLLIHGGPLMAEYKRGTVVVVEATVKDPSEEPPILFNPTSIVLNIWNPDGTVKVSSGAMSNISTGFYRYLHQTTGGDQLGAYTLDIVAVSGGNTSRVNTAVGFRLKG